MGVLSASNSTSDYAPEPGKTTNTAYYSSRVDYGMVLYDNIAYVQRDPHPESSTTVTWYHMGLWYDTGTAFETGYFFQWRATNGALLCGMDINPAGYSAAAGVVYGDSTVSGTFFAISQSYHTFDVKITVDASNITMAIYVDKVLTQTVVAANVTGAKGKPAFFNPVMADMLYTSAFALVISEIIISEDDTRDMQMLKREPSGAGFHTDFTGDYVALGDESEATLALASVSGDRVSSVIPTVTTGAPIIAVVLKARVAKFGIAPVNIRQGMRVNGVDYDGALVTPGANLVGITEVFDVDPDTGVAWLAAGVAAAEPMLKAET